MTIRDRVRQWLGLDAIDRHYDEMTNAILGLNRIVTSSGEWAAQNGLAIQAQLSDLNAKLDKLAAIIEPQSLKFIRATPRVLSFEAAQFEDLAASIEQEKTNGVHR
jgi:hypothetical protein